MNVVVIIIAAIVFAVHIIKDREVEDVGLKVKEYPKPQPIFSDFRLSNIKRPEIFGKTDFDDRVIKLHTKIKNSISDFKHKIYPIFTVETKIDSVIKSKSRSQIRSN